MTKKTYKRLQEKLHYLTTVKALEIKKALKEAKSGGGGMHDNAAYDNALMQERMLARQIKDLAEKLQNPIFIDDLSISTDKVSVGTLVKVCVSDFENRKEEIKEYSILGPEESDPGRYIISYLSPIGKSLIGRHIGEKIEVAIADKHFMFEILEIRIAEL